MSFSQIFEISFNEIGRHFANNFGFLMPKLLLKSWSISINWILNIRLKLVKLKSYILTNLLIYGMEQMVGHSFWDIIRAGFIILAPLGYELVAVLKYMLPSKTKNVVSCKNQQLYASSSLASKKKTLPSYQNTIWRTKTYITKLAKSFLASKKTNVYIIISSKIGCFPDNEINKSVLCRNKSSILFNAP